MQLRLEALSREELENIHTATLAVLEKTGVDIESEDVRKLLKDNGATVNGANVSLPADMVEKAIGRINKEVKLSARDPKYSIVLPSRDTLNSTSGYAAYTYDMESSESRPSSTDDLIDYAILADALSEVDIFWPIVMPTEIESQQMQEISALDVSFRNTSKHVQCSLADGETAKYQIKLAAALAGGEDNLRENPLFSVVSSPFTPLEFKKGTAESYLPMARAGIPVVPMNVPMAGTTAPVTLAGAVVMTNAEQLATLVILKCADPSAPMVYSSDTGTAEMKSGGMNYDSPDRPVLCASMAQVARYYGFPSCVSHDTSELKTYTLRTGFERNALRIAINCMTHSDLAIWMGSLDDALSASLWDLLLDAEALKLAKEYNRWRDVNENTLAVDIIDKIGPSGHFFGCAHTVKNFRKEVSLYDYRKNFIFADEDMDYIEKAKNIVREILKSHKPAPVPGDRLYAMDEVIAEARRYYGG
jgi:trimethylamine--corrinoid protein Co-methyltransferase